MKKESVIRFADSNVKKAFEELKNSASEKWLFSAINRAFDSIEDNAFCGTQVPKHLIPHEYIRKYNIDNLWKYNLPKGWRLLYSVASDGITVISIIIEWLDHKKYERRFSYDAG